MSDYKDRRAYPVTAIHGMEPKEPEIIDTANPYPPGQPVLQVTQEQLEAIYSQPVSHTPGPWHVGAVGKMVVVYPADESTFVAELGFGEQAAIDARLIAAAPEMYEVLKAIEPDCSILYTDLEKRLLAVIAKAEGR